MRALVVAACLAALVSLAAVHGGTDREEVVAPVELVEQPPTPLDDYEQALVLLKRLNRHPWREAQSNRRFDHQPLNHQRDGSTQSLVELVNLLLHYIGHLVQSFYHVFTAAGHSAVSSKRHNQDLRTARDLLGKSFEETENPDAAFALAEIELHGFYGLSPNVSKAFELYDWISRTTGNATAQSRAGLILATGHLGKESPDLPASLVYHTFAAYSNESASRMTLGYRYLVGIGSRDDCEAACIQYQKAAEASVAHYLSGPPGGRMLPPKSLKYRIADDVNGGVYGNGASAVSTGIHALRSKALRGSLGAAGHSADSDWKEVLEYWRYMADRGDIRAQYGLGELYWLGSRRVARRPSRALQYFLPLTKMVWQDAPPQEVAETNLPDAPRLNPDGSPPGHGTLSLEQASAVRAATFVGLAYLRGEGFPTSYPQAAVWLTRAMEFGDHTAQDAIGLMWRDGLGVKADLDKAFLFFSAAAMHSYADSLSNIGLLQLERGQIAAGVNGLEIAANSQNFLAQFHMANIYRHGLFHKEADCTKATSLYKAVAERGDWLWSPFPEMLRAIQSNDNHLLLLANLKGAEMGYEIAQNNVAWLLDPIKTRHHSETAQEDVSQNRLAMANYIRSANGGNIDALVKTGDYYYAGLAVTNRTPLYEKAIACYQAAAETQQSALSMWNLGYMYEHGRGVPQDFHLAKRYYDLCGQLNTEAVWPLTFSLWKLNLHSLWRRILNRRRESPSSPSPSSSSSSPSSRRAFSVSDINLWGYGRRKMIDGSSGEIALEDDSDEEDLLDRARRQRDEDLQRRQLDEEQDDDWYNDPRSRADFGAGPAVGFPPSGYGEDVPDSTSEVVIILGLVLFILWLLYSRRNRDRTRQAQARDQAVPAGDIGEVRAPEAAPVPAAMPVHQPPFMPPPPGPT